MSMHKKSAKDIAFDRERVKFRQEIKSLKSEIRNQQKQISEYRYQIEEYADEIRSQADWIERLLEFMDVPEEDLKMLVEQTRSKVNLVDKINGLTGIILGNYLNSWGN